MKKNHYPSTTSASLLSFTSLLVAQQVPKTSANARSARSVAGKSLLPKASPEHSSSHTLWRVTTYKTSSLPGQLLHVCNTVRGTLKTAFGGCHMIQIKCTKNGHHGTISSAIRTPSKIIISKNHNLNNSFFHFGKRFL